MTNVFDKLQASRPVNSAAARVIGPGFHYEPQKVVTQRHWKTPPKCKPISAEQRANVQFQDMSGVSFGRFRVVGYLGRTSQGGSASWLCRCACGDFEARTAKAIRNPENRGDRCDYCRHVAHLKRATAFRANPLGKEQDVRDL